MKTDLNTNDGKYCSSFINFPANVECGASCALCAAPSQESNAAIVCPLYAEFENALGIVVQSPESFSEECYDFRMGEHHEHSELGEIDRRVRALETVLSQKGYIDPAALDTLSDQGWPAQRRTGCGARLG